MPPQPQGGFTVPPNAIRQHSNAMGAGRARAFGVAAHLKCHDCLPGFLCQGTTYLETCDNTGICTKITSLNDAAVAQLTTAVDNTYLAAFTGESLGASAAQMACVVGCMVGPPVPERVGRIIFLVVV